MDNLKRIIVVFILLIFSITAFSNSNSISAAPSSNDQRMFLPSYFYNSYVGLDAGWGNFYFTNANLPSGITAASINNQQAVLQAFIGHYFDPYIALQISLMRPIQWVKFQQISGGRGTHTVWMSTFGLTLRPTWPITSRFSLFGLAGLAYTSRHGFWARGTMISDNSIFSFLTGAGLSYALTPHWHLQTTLSYVLARKSQNQPGILFGTLGAYYAFTPPAPGTVETTPYIFPHNTLELGFFTSALFDFDAGKYLTPPYVPIFWDGDVKAQNAAYIMYTRDIFHTERTFSLDIGASFSRFVSRGNQVFYTFSIFPAIRLWLIRSKYVDFYFFYSIAGPTFITQRVIDNMDTGELFTFQDLLGFGFYLGKEKHFNFNVKIGHYSNGNLFTQNPGIAIPVSVAFGYAF